MTDVPCCTVSSFMFSHPPLQFIYIVACCSNTIYHLFMLHVDNKTRGGKKENLKRNLNLKKIRNLVIRFVCFISLKENLVYFLNEV